MSKCPLCFTVLATDRRTWRAISGETAADPVATRYYGSSVVAGRLVESAFANGVSTPSRRDAAKQLGSPVMEACPHCHYPIPDDWRGHRTVCIAMAGARTTGKTIFIAVLVKVLQLFGERIGCVVEPNDQRTAETYGHHYEHPLYVERKMLPPTTGIEVDKSFHRDPLVFRLGRAGGEKQLLVIRDVAGEDLHQVNNVSMMWTEFFGHADGVIYMFDPLKVSSVADQLRDLIPVQDKHDVEPLTVLQTVIAMIGGHAPKLAVVLSKFDALHALKDVAGTEWSAIMDNPGAGFSRDPSLSRKPYDNDDGQLVDAEVRSLLSKLGAQSIVDAVDNPHTGAELPARFFAVSALGALTVGSQVHEGGISPFRCLDPARWILNGAGVWS